MKLRSRRSVRSRQRGFLINAYSFGGGSLPPAASGWATTNPPASPAIPAQPASFAFSNSNRTITGTGSSGTHLGCTMGTVSHTYGKWYFELHLSVIDSACLFGVVNANATLDDSWIDGTHAKGDIAYRLNSQCFRDASGGGATYVGAAASFTTAGDVMGVALDMDNGSISFFKNNVGQIGTAYSVSPCAPYACMQNSTTTVTLCTQTSQFAYSPPSGYQPGDATYAPPTSFALDPYTTGLWSARAFKKLLASYTGPCIKVRRSSDSTTQDIGFNPAGNLDVPALLTFVGSGSGYLVRHYDQSGNGNDFLNLSGSHEPIIVSSGSYLGRMQYNLSGYGVSGTIDNLLSANNGGGVATMSIFRKMAIRGYSGTALSFEFGDGSQIAGSGGAGQLQDQPVSTSQNFAYMAGTGATYGVQCWNAQESGTSGAATVVGMIFARGLTPAYTGISKYQTGFGAAVVPNGSGNDSGSTGLPTGNFPAYKWREGGRTDGYGAQLDIWSCAIYNADKSSDALAIVAALA